MWYINTSQSVFTHSLQVNLSSEDHQLKVEIKVNKFQHGFEQVTNNILFVNVSSAVSLKMQV